MMSRKPPVAKQANKNKSFQIKNRKAEDVDKQY